MPPRAKSQSKIPDYTDEAEILKVISHPVRLKIIYLLIEKPSNVKIIWTKLGLAQATVSQHLAVLKSHGIIKGKRNGNTIVYSTDNALAKKVILLLQNQKRTKKKAK